MLYRKKNLLLIFILSIVKSYTQIPVTNPERSDGFGAQFQTIIYSVLFAELNDLPFTYSPFNQMEHNYENDIRFLEKKEELINFIDNFERAQKDHIRLSLHEMINFFESNIVTCSKSNALKRIKRLFRINKTRTDYFSSDYVHIVVHIRRPNSHDSRIDGADTPDGVYLRIINALRARYHPYKLLFHIQSQGNEANFKNFIAPDVVLHLNESVEDSFTSMVLADVLVTSRSSFSYTAGILSEGIVYYMPFWHPPLPGWKLISELCN